MAPGTTLDNGSNFAEPLNWYHVKNKQNRYSDKNLQTGWGLGKFEFDILKSHVKGMKPLVNPQGQSYKGGQTTLQTTHFEKLTELKPAIIPLVARAPKEWTILAICNWLNRLASNPGPATSTQQTTPATNPNPVTSVSVGATSSSLLQSPALPIDSGSVSLPSFNHRTERVPLDYNVYGIPVPLEGRVEGGPFGRTSLRYITGDTHVDWNLFKKEAEMWEGFNLDKKVYAPCLKDWAMPITSSGGLGAAVEEAFHFKHESLLLTAEKPLQRYVIGKDKRRRGSDSSSEQPLSKQRRYISTTPHLAAVDVSRDVNANSPPSPNAPDHTSRSATPLEHDINTQRRPSDDNTNPGRLSVPPSNPVKVNTTSRPDTSEEGQLNTLGDDDSQPVANSPAATGVDDAITADDVRLEFNDDDSLPLVHPPAATGVDDAITADDVRLEFNDDDSQPVANSPAATGVDDAITADDVRMDLTGDDHSQPLGHPPAVEVLDNPNALVDIQASKTVNLLSLQLDRSNIPPPALLDLENLSLDPNRMPTRPKSQTPPLSHTAPSRTHTPQSSTKLHPHSTPDPEHRDEWDLSAASKQQPTTGARNEHTGSNGASAGNNLDDCESDSDLDDNDSDSDPDDNDSDSDLEIIGERRLTKQTSEDDKSHATVGGDDELEDDMEVAAVDEQEARLAAVRDTVHDRGLRTRLAHISDQAIRRACRMFPFLTEEQLRKSDRISLLLWELSKHFKAAPYQIIAVSEMICQESGTVSGGVLADDMGLGKTIVTILCWVYRTYRYDNYVEVLQEWRADPAPTPLRHLPKDYNGNEAKCPSHNLLPVACWCLPGTRRELCLPNHGSTLFVVPKPAHGAFYSEMCMLFNPDRGGTFLKNHDMRIVFHEGANVTNATKNTFRMFPHFVDVDEAAQFCRRFDPAEITQSYIKENAEYGLNDGSRFTRSWTTHISGLKNFQRPRKGAGPSISRKASRLLVLVTPKCYAGFRDMFLTTVCAVGTAHKGASLRRTESRFLLVFSHIHIDEYHLATNGVFQKRILNDARVGCKIIGDYRVVWGASGTPDGNNLLSPLAFCARFTNLGEWGHADNGYPILQELAARGPDAILEVGNALKRAITRYNGDTAALARLETWKTVSRWLHKALPLVMIRRPLSMRWYDGKRIIKLDSKLAVDVKPVEPLPGEAIAIKEAEDQIRAVQKEQYTKSMDAWKRKGAEPKDKPVKLMDTRTQGYVTAFSTASVGPVVSWWKETYPAEASQHQFTATAPTLANLRDSAHTDFWMEQIPAIMENCAKWIELRKMLNDIKHQRRRVPDPDNPGKFMDGGRRKVLITSRWPMIAAIYQCCLCYLFPGQVVEYLSKTSTDAREASLQSFREDPNVWIMIASASCLDVGLNLQVASVGIHLDPSGSLAAFAQLIARMFRQGQKDASVNIYILVTKGSTLQEKLAQQLQDRQAVQNKILGGTALVSAVQETKD